MLNALQLQLLTTLAAASTRPTTADSTGSADLTTQDMWRLLTTLLDEMMEHANAAAGPILLEWRFTDDSLPSHCYQMDVAVAGTYYLVSQTNCARVSVLLDDRPVASPFRVRAGEQLTVTIERATPGEAAVWLLSIGTYRQFLAAAS
jgi:hypothetical protein